MVGLCVWSAATAVAAVAAVADGKILHLQPLKNWTSTNGIPDRKNVFCRTANLEGITRPTAYTSQALQAICNYQERDKFFSGSAIDSFMASRFINLSTSLHATAAEPPKSTEPNTPWMLADVVLTTLKEQKRADSARTVRGRAQVDLFLCVERDCNIIVDILKVQKRPNVWSLATSGIAADAFQVGVGTAADLQQGDKVLNTKRIPSDLSKGPDSGKLEVHDVVWRQAGAQGPSPNDKACKRLYKPAQVVPFDAQAELASFASSPWRTMYVSYHKHRGTLRSWKRPMFQSSHGCMAYIWPNHAWMHEHGWGESDPECAGEFNVTRVNVCADGKQAAVAIVNSMFPQAQFADRAKFKPLQEFVAVGFHNVKVKSASSTSNITDATTAVALLHPLNPSDISAHAVFPPYYEADGADDLLVEYTHVLSRLGNADQTHIRWASHRATGCIEPCGELISTLPTTDGTVPPSPNANCGFCTLFGVGKSTVAAVPAAVPDKVGDLINYTMGDFVTALLDLADRGAQAGNPPPWCIGLPEAQWKADVLIAAGFDYSKEVSLSLQKMTMASKHLSVRLMNESVVQTLRPFQACFCGDLGLQNPLDSLCDNELDTQAHFSETYKLMAHSIVQNCTFWDNMGVGYVHGGHGHNDPQPARRNNIAASSLADAAYVTWWPVDEGTSPGFDGPMRGIRRVPSQGFGEETKLNKLSAEKLEQAIDQLVMDAAYLLDQAVTQELAITDSTDTVLGALFDLSVIVLGFVATASGKAEVEKWIAGFSHSVYVCVSKHPQSDCQSDGCNVAAQLVFCLILLPLTLIMVPALVLVSFIAAREQNAKGDSSKIGWLAAEPRNYQGTHYMVVGAVTVSYKAEYDEVAYMILICNIPLAVLGTLVIWTTSFLTMWSKCRAAAQSRGVGGGPLTTRGSTHASRSNDLEMSRCLDRA